MMPTCSGSFSLRMQNHNQTGAQHGIHIGYAPVLRCEHDGSQDYRAYPLGRYADPQGRYADAGLQGQAGRDPLASLALSPAPLRPYRVLREGPSAGTLRVRCREEHGRPLRRQNQRPRELSPVKQFSTLAGRPPTASPEGIYPS